MSFFGKRFKRTKVENLENFMDATNTDAKMRENLRKGEAIHMFSENDDGTYTHLIEMPERKIETNFRLGQEVEQPRPDGVLMKVKYELAGDTLIQTLEFGDKHITFDREFSGDTMKMTVSEASVTETVISTYEIV